MNIDFNDKVVVVTGATRGIGKQIADDLSSLGAQLILTGTRKEQVDELNKSEGSDKRKYFCVDFSDAKSSQSFVEELSKRDKIDICINNAGISRIGLVEDTLEKDWDQMMDVNLKAPYLVTRAVAPIMKKNGYGRIINISSIFGIISKAKRSIYSTTKFGIRGLTVATSNELASYGVLVNSVSPGFVLTDMTKKNLSEDERTELASQVPAGRLGSPKDISNAVLFLASDLNTYITGKNIVVDGGFIDV